MSRNRVVFVDDEPKILQGLERMLRGIRKEQHMAFVKSGHEALDPLARGTMLGLDTIQALVLSAHVFSQFKQPVAGINLDQLWQHTTLVGTFAKRIAEAEGAHKQAKADAPVTSRMTTFRWPRRCMRQIYSLTSLRPPGWRLSKWETQKASMSWRCGFPCGGSFAASVCSKGEVDESTYTVRG